MILATRLMWSEVSPLSPPDIKGSSMSSRVSRLVSQMQTRFGKTWTEAAPRGPRSMALATVPTSQFNTTMRSGCMKTKSVRVQSRWLHKSGQVTWLNKGTCCTKMYFCSVFWFLFGGEFHNIHYILHVWSHSCPRLSPHSSPFRSRMLMQDTIQPSIRSPQFFL